MKNVLVFTLLVLITSCSLDNKKGGTFGYSIIENETDKDLVIKAYNNQLIIDSLFVEPFSFRVDTSYDGNGKQDSYFPEYYSADSIALIFNDLKYIGYTAFYNPTPSYKLINGKNLIGVGWEEIENVKEKKTIYITTKFIINEQDFIVADSL